MIIKQKKHSPFSSPFMSLPDDTTIGIPPENSQNFSLPSSPTTPDSPIKKEEKKILLLRNRLMNAQWPGTFVKTWGKLEEIFPSACYLSSHSLARALGLISLSCFFLFFFSSVMCLVSLFMLFFCVSLDINFVFMLSYYCYFCYFFIS